MAGVQRYFGILAARLAHAKIFARDETRVIEGGESLNRLVSQGERVAGDPLRHQVEAQAKMAYFTHVGD